MQFAGELAERIANKRSLKTGWGALVVDAVVRTCVCGCGWLRKSRRLAAEAMQFRGGVGHLLRLNSFTHRVYLCLYGVPQERKTGSIDEQKRFLNKGPITGLRGGRVQRYEQ